MNGCYDDAYAKALQLKDEMGYTFVHPFDDEAVIAGQGTIGLEIASDLDDVDAVIVPVGGGGLISGVAYELKSIRPSIKVYGVHHERAGSTESVNGCYLRIVMETRNYDHVVEIKEALRSEGFKIVE